MAYRVMVGAAQAVGFRTDVKLNRMAEHLREQFQTGFKGINKSAELRRAALV